MKILCKSQKGMPGIKAIPVPAEEDAPETAPVEPAEPVPDTPNAEAKEESVEQIVKPKAKRRPKEEVEKEKAEKAARKAEKEQEKVDLKARVRCPVCKKGPMSQHALLYTHKCADADLKKLPRQPTLEEKFPEPKEEEEEPEQIIVKRKAKKVVQYVEGDSDYDEIPPPPPLIRQPAPMSYREILAMRQAEVARSKAHREVGVIRSFFRR